MVLLHVMSGVWSAIHLSKSLGKEIFQKCKLVNRQMFHKYLLVTNVGISASLSLAGDVIQQYYEIIQHKNRTWDLNRALNMTVSGISVGVICHFCYQYLDRKFPGRSLKIVMKKVAIDQFLCSPVCITTFFATTCAMERVSFKEFKQELIYKGFKLYVAEWVIWPPAQIINFYFLPPRFRVLYDNMISLGYDIYTSYVKNEISMDEEPQDATKKVEDR